MIGHELPVEDFHAVGLASEKALEVVTVLVRGTLYSPRGDEPKWAHPPFRYWSDHIHSVTKKAVLHTHIHLHAVGGSLVL